MRFHRPQRVGKFIQKELGKIIARELEFPGALVTITDAEIDKKLETAEIKLSIFPPVKEEEILKILRKNRGRLQYFLTKKINIKPMPRINFEIDSGQKNAADIEKILSGR